MPSNPNEINTPPRKRRRLTDAEKLAEIDALRAGVAKRMAENEARAAERAAERELARKRKVLAGLPDYDIACIADALKDYNSGMGNAILARLRGEGA